MRIELNFIPPFAYASCYTLLLFLKTCSKFSRSGVVRVVSISKHRSQVLRLMNNLLNGCHNNTSKLQVIMVILSHCSSYLCVSFNFNRKLIIYSVNQPFLYFFKRGRNYRGFFPKIQISGDQVFKRLFNPSNLDGT